MSAARSSLAAPVTCEACGADAFAIVSTHVDDPAPARTRVALRCGACGLWQDRTLDARTLTRFLEHHDATRRQIARLLVAMLRAAATPAAGETRG
jgi:hypothetical protein